MQTVLDMIEKFDHDCAARGHSYTHNPVRPDTQYCQACGHVRFYPQAPQTPVKE